MKKSMLIYSFLLFSFSTELIAQKINEGVYLSANDFTSGKVSFVNNQSKKYKLYVHNAYNKSTIKIIIGDSVIKLNKDSIFGFRDKDNTCYRFYNKVAYKIINPSEKILLYSTTSSVGAPKNTHWVVNYFFSANANSPICALSKWNLKTVFSSDVTFIELLNTYFQSDSELIAYDNINKKYNLNRIYEMHLQNK